MIDKSFLRSADDKVGDLEAMNEHARKGSKIPFCCSQETLAQELRRSMFGFMRVILTLNSLSIDTKRFGEGIYQYFDFIFYLIVTNVLLLVTSLISLIPHFIIDGWQSDLPRGPQENFYLSSYSPQMYWVCTIFYFIHIPFA